MEDDNITMEEYKKVTKKTREIANKDYGSGKPINCIHFEFPTPYDEHLTCGLQYEKNIYTKCLLLDGKECEHNLG